MQNRLNQQKDLIIDLGRRMWQSRFVAANAGNISVLLDDETILTTPTGVSKGFMRAEMLITVDRKGQILQAEKDYRPSSELKMHLEVYNQRPDVRAVVHTHPPGATTFAVLGQTLSENILPEVVLNLGIIPLAAYGLPSSAEIPNSLRPHLQTSDAILLQNHGCLTVGADLANAYFKLEILEHYCQILYRCRQLGKFTQLADAEIEKLIALRKKLNLPGKALLQGKQHFFQF
ncbi:MAG: class II aldolase/adducin family protein [Candidatus Cloacimonadales bacterium]